nr:urea carboxylase-associated family protein [Kibdelosporangium sp. MJ126-NF4]CTQ89333.1 Aminomethyltransferase (EC 2.1.2.10) [Kibdelosporangium sp. MJ126-NF4]
MELTRVRVPAGQGRAVRVAAGQFVQVSTPKGAQVGDLFAFSADEYLSAAHTRGHTSRLFPALGESFVTDRRRPILTLTDDTSPGCHDMLIPACDPARYRLLGHDGWHASCAENLTTALREHGVDKAGVDRHGIPQPVNLFMDIPVTADGVIEWRSSPAAPGAAVTLRAELDCLVVLSACPQDLVDINGMRPGPLDIEVLETA